MRQVSKLSNPHIHSPLRKTGMGPAKSSELQAICADLRDSSYQAATLSIVLR